MHLAELKSSLNHASMWKIWLFQLKFFFIFNCRYCYSTITSCLLNKTDKCYNIAGKCLQSTNEQTAHVRSKSCWTVYASVRTHPKLYSVRCQHKSRWMTTVYRISLAQLKWKENIHTRHKTILCRQSNVKDNCPAAQH